SSYRLALSKTLKSRGVHDVFHSSLLRIHEPNDDRLFPGRMDSQVTAWEDYAGKEAEWAVSRIVTHSGKGADTLFEVEWTSG
ncbi:hypothetical protein NEOLEDRAFT_1029700, partial [Neolentinus lepideus HHB14362 ss-1]